MKNSVKRKGFTLVELLIVIVVIGILSAMMMMSSTEAVTSAKASNIVSNIRNLKTAALAYYTDNLDDFADSSTSSTAKIDKDAWFKYLNGGENIPDKDNYSLIANDEGWFVGCSVDGTAEERERIRVKLAGRAKSVGLLKTASSTDVYVYGENNDKVYVYVR